MIRFLSAFQVLGSYPVVVSTWPFVDAVRAAWRSADAGSPAVDAVVDGCSECEVLRCDGTGFWIMNRDTSGFLYRL